MKEEKKDEMNFHGKLLRKIHEKAHEEIPENDQRPPYFQVSLLFLLF